MDSKAEHNGNGLGDPEPAYEEQKGREVTIEDAHHAAERGHLATDR
jgi:hypothetical protein